MRPERAGACRNSHHDLHGCSIETTLSRMGRGAVVTDIIDTIDALVEEQMAEGERQCGADPLVCPHCGRDWHGFPLTEQIAEMRSSGLFDEDYKVAGDDSPVLCPGSNVYGPARPQAMHSRPCWHISPGRRRGWPSTPAIPLSGSAPTMPRW